MAKMKRLDLIPPGETLLEEFCGLLELHSLRLARDIDIPVSRVGEIIHGKRSITADTVLRLAKFFNRSPDVWFHLQMEDDLRWAQRDTWPAIEGRIRTFEAAE
jgi:addiction module HigA family antidote